MTRLPLHIHWLSIPSLWPKTSFLHVKESPCWSHSPRWQPFPNLWTYECVLVPYMSSHIIAYTWSWPLLPGNIHLCDQKWSSLCADSNYLKASAYFFSSCYFWKEICSWYLHVQLMAWLLTTSHAHVHFLAMGVHSLHPLCLPLRWRQVVNDMQLWSFSVEWWLCQACLSAALLYEGRQCLWHDIEMMKNHLFFIQVWDAYMIWCPLRWNVWIGFSFPLLMVLDFAISIENLSWFFFIGDECWSMWMGSHPLPLHTQFYATLLQKSSRYVT